MSSVSCFVFFVSHRASECSFCLGGLQNVCLEYMAGDVIYMHLMKQSSAVSTISASKWCQKFFRDFPSMYRSAVYVKTFFMKSLICFSLACSLHSAPLPPCPVIPLASGHFRSTFNYVVLLFNLNVSAFTIRTPCRDHSIISIYFTTNKAALSCYND